MVWNKARYTQVASTTNTRSRSEQRQAIITTTHQYHSLSSSFSPSPPLSPPRLRPPSPPPKVLSVQIITFSHIVTLHSDFSIHPRNIFSYISHHSFRDSSTFTGASNVQQPSLLSYLSFTVPPPRLTNHGRTCPQPHRLHQLQIWFHPVYMTKRV